ncbi:MAG: glycerol-3-phosphate dehydrogenase [Gammaproteobacteria bacterium]|nr:glycerol-3-phosphate dehydrogenase [Gammaproteobacteria bacterium]
MNSVPDSKLVQTDILVIGGGINGVGIARDAAGRGLRVYLCEKDDLAQHTSSASTKLIHGGLRYLEYYDFRLVRHALAEREVLLRTAPHIIHPLRFILPHHKALRPKWMIRLGLFLYDHLGGRKLLPASCGVNLNKHVAGQALKSQYTSGFEYSDCWVHDARLVVLTAMDAAARGAVVKTRTECIALDRFDNHWVATLKEEVSGNQIQVKADTVVNASGPWVDRVLRLGVPSDREHGVRFVKGSHVVVPKLFDHPYPYIFQNADGRVLFAIPFEHEFTLLGTTDIEVSDIPKQASITSEETAYICEAISEYFKQPIVPDDVVWSYSGVRPLYDDAASSASKVTRDYNLHLNSSAAPVISVYGGKITTYRKLAEEVLDLLSGAYPIPGHAWTSMSHLPGGDIANADLEVFLTLCNKRYPWIDQTLLKDYVTKYGTRISTLLEGCGSMDDLGKRMSPGLYEREVAYLMKHEYARSADDVLWRRTKHGLHASSLEIEQLDNWMKQQLPEVACS